MLHCIRQPVIMFHTDPKEKSRGISDQCRVLGLVRDQNIHDTRETGEYDSHYGTAFLAFLLCLSIFDPTRLPVSYYIASLSGGVWRDKGDEPKWIKTLPHAKYYPLFAGCFICY